MKRASRAIPLLCIATLLCSSPLIAGGRRRAVAVSPSSSDLAITFLGPGAVLDAGTIVWRGGRRNATVTVRTVQMRIGSPSQEARGTATLRAFVESADRNCAIRVNGTLLTTVPQIVQRHAPIGIAIPHRIEIEVPTSAPDGPLQTSVGWEVTTD
jgi:hypothetical protein